jgi:hypothetical protein
MGEETVMPKPLNKSRIMAREAALVDAQCLLQQALNETYGNPRDFEETDPAKTNRLFEKQRLELSQILSRRVSFITCLFADNSNGSIKNFAEALDGLGYDLKLDIVKRET